MIKQILTGWKNFINKSEVTESLAKQRAQICSNCPHARQGKILAFIKDTFTQIKGAYCQKCGCPLSAKVRSNDICPIQKW